MPTVAGRIYAAIRERIIAGHYAPGEHITEQQVAAIFQTSRTPVREALRLLVAEGFAHFRPNSGTVVREWTPAEMHQIFQLRLLVECEVAAEAAQRITPEQIGELVQVQDELEQHYYQGGAPCDDRVGQLNRKFHQGIAQACGNERLVATLSTAQAVPVVHQTFRRYTSQQLLRSFHHHRELIDAFNARDSEWARSAMSSHIHSARHTLLGEYSHDHEHP